MLSRGYNHRGGCACRFCQPRRVGETLPTTADLIPVEGTSYSYTRPTTCPVCGEAIFLFMSEHGGRVFFDELGPPWPKHPCTDAASASPLVKSISSSDHISIRRYAWQEAGWLPLTNVVVEFSSLNNVRLSGLHAGKQFAACILLSELQRISSTAADLAYSPIHARLSIAGVYEVAFLSSDILPRMVIATPELPPLS